MGDISNISRGASPRPIHSFISNAQDAVPWIKIGDTENGGKYITATSERITQQGASKSKIVRPGDFVLSNSMSFGRPYISSITGCIHDGWLSISNFEGSFIADFLYHILLSRAVQNEWRRRVGTGTVKNLNAEIVKTTILPIPPLEIQKKSSLSSTNSIPSPLTSPTAFPQKYKLANSNTNTTAIACSLSNQNNHHPIKPSTHFHPARKSTQNVPTHLQHPP